MVGQIPIRNIFYLLSYAWESIEQVKNKTLLSAESFTNSAGLVAKLLDLSINSIKGRGFQKSYFLQNEEISGIKGKLAFSDSISKGCLFIGKAVCDYDEFGHNSILNQILKATLISLLSDSTLNKESKEIIYRNIELLREVNNIILTKNVFRAVKLNSHTKHYRFAIELCKLYFDSISISDDSSAYDFSNFFSNTAKMSKIFEKFIRNFYESKLQKNSVSAPKQHWKVGEESDELFKNLVPELRTDVVITQNNRKIIIDAKFYKEALSSNSETPKFRRDHLSQIMEYLRTVKDAQEQLNTTGVLLYPTVHEYLDHSGIIEGFNIRVATVDLSLQWEEIEKRLLGLIESELLKRPVPKAA